jgi:dihydropteroate synthase
MAMKTRIMAILNVTPDSFSDGGKLCGPDNIVREAEKALAAGAHILDIGGESTRPRAVQVSVDEELQRVAPAIEAIRQRFPQAMISIDTRKAAVAEAAVAAGAGIINDVSGLQFDPAMARTAARLGTELVIMHSQGTPETMQDNPHYPMGVVTEVKAFFERQIALAIQAGVCRERIILDPGFGFGKTRAHNLALLHELEGLQDLKLPILVGASRKSFLAMGDPAITADKREVLTAAAMALAIQKGAAMVRVHDVEAQAPVVRLVEGILRAEASS